MLMLPDDDEAKLKRDKKQEMIHKFRDQKSINHKSRLAVEHGDAFINQHAACFQFIDNEPNFKAIISEIRSASPDTKKDASFMIPQNLSRLSQRFNLSLSLSLLLVLPSRECARNNFSFTRRLLLLPLTVK